MVYGLPGTLKQEADSQEPSESEWSPASVVVVSAVSEVPGVAIALVFGAAIGRRHNMTLAFSMTAMFLLCTIHAISSEDAMNDEGVASVLGVKLFLASGYIVVYLYLLECYPTKIRATGLAFCMVLGRAGGFWCPVIFDGLVYTGLAHELFFVLMAGMIGAASIACVFLPFETKDAALS